jgi:hypothetical protein
MEAVHGREAIGEQLLEGIDARFQRGSLAQPIAHRSDTPAPEIPQSCVSFRELAGVNAEQEPRRSGAKLGADGTEGRLDFSFLEV